MSIKFPDSWLPGKKRSNNTYTLCSYCHGSGKKGKKTCEVCEGLGIVKTSNKGYWGH